MALPQARSDVLRVARSDIVGVEDHVANDTHEVCNIGLSCVSFNTKVFADRVARAGQRCRVGPASACAGAMYPRIAEQRLGRIVAAEEEKLLR